MNELDNIFSAKGILSQHLHGYTPREGQQKMAQAVFELLERSKDVPIDLDHFGEEQRAQALVVEAETGLGKTLAYTIPAILSGRKVVISTNTRNLQDQILEREIPLIQKYIAPQLRALCVKGRQNYLCLFRFNQYRSEQEHALFTDNQQQRLNTWVEHTSYGDRAELPWLPATSPLWQQICCVSHLCLGTDCPHHQDCCLNQVRRDAASSQLLIVNHHLLFSDLAVRQTGYGEVLPRYEAVFFDEAHHIESVASTFFGTSFSKLQVLDLTRDIERSVGAVSASGRASSTEILALCRVLSGSIERFSALFPTGKGRYLLTELVERSPAIFDGRMQVLATLDRLAELLGKEDSHQEPWEQYMHRAQELKKRLQKILSLEQEEEENHTSESPALSTSTYWCERTDRNLSLHMTPVDISKELEQTLYSSVDCCLFTSATISTGKTFDYFCKRLGLAKDTPTMAFPSPFDYRQKSLLYIPATGFPEPNGEGYQEAVHEEIAQLIISAQGRSLVLFTSFLAMQAAYTAMQERLSFPLLMQGQAPRRRLLQDFMEKTESVLFAVASFWEGVDVPGESLSMVIMDKLPFEVPSDPVIMARINRIKARGGAPFFEFQVPRAILSLRQGAGRLMRSSSDRGVIAILDIRLFTKGYGRHFLKSLPPSPVCRELQRVYSFFNTETVS